MTAQTSGSPTLLFNDLIPIINKLQDIFTIAGTSNNSSSGGDASSNLVLELPQIVVVGSQSSGKSSVLESIVGKDFLPRGSGIVTRRPLVLQLFNTPVNPKNNGINEWGEFLHKPGVRFGVFSEIRTEIERETDRLTGVNKGVSDVPINLKVYSPNVVNLTLVDLPGITRVPIGDQPPDIEKQIRSMIMRYITPPNAIVLAVTAGNSDVTNSDALRLARDVDPDGQRTLGVITKIDIMDKGTDAMDVLCGRVVPLRLGYIGVVLRSQKDIQDQKDVKKALTDEKTFFETHPIYKSIAAKSGVPFLAKTLNKLLLHHITSYVPTLRTRLTEMRQNTMKEIAQCGPATDDNETTMQVRLLDIIAQVAEKFKHGLEMKDEDEVGELASGARIHYVFHDVFGKAVGAMDPLLGVSDNDIKTCLHNAAGTRPALFIAEAAFELLARRQIALLREPAMQCIDMVHEELRRVVNALEVPALNQYHALRDGVEGCFRRRLQLCVARTKQVVNDILDVELAFINIAHPDFGGSDEVTSRLLKNTMRNKHADGAAAVAMPTTTTSKPRKNDETLMLRRVPGQIRAGSYQTDKEKFEIDVIKTLLVSYFDIVRKRLRDLVPKSAMLFLVQKCQADMQNALVQDLYGDPAKVVKLMQVADELVVRRRELTSLLTLLDQAVNVLATIGQRPTTFS